MKANLEILESVYEIGPNITESIIRFFSDKNNLKIINRLKNSGVNFKMEPNENKLVDILNGKIFVLTGELENFSRQDAKALIEERGGKVTTSVSKKTNFVVCGKNPGSKFDKAKSSKIPVLNENEFKKMLEIPET